MKQRSKYSNQAAFENFINSESANIPLVLELLKNPKDVRHELQLLRSVFSSKLRIMIAKYSMGMDIGNLKNDFPEVVDAYFEIKCNKNNGPIHLTFIDDYNHSLWLMSLAYLLELDNARHNKLIEVIGNKGVDAIYDHLVALKTGESVNITKTIFSKSYSHLLAGITNKENGGKEIKQFFSLYYKSMKDAYWHDDHLAGIYFFGYWCFEVAALVKGLNLNDDLYKENEYYPRDLTGRDFVFNN